MYLGKKSCKGRLVEKWGFGALMAGFGVRQNPATNDTVDGKNPIPNHLGMVKNLINKWEKSSSLVVFSGFVDPSTVPKSQVFAPHQMRATQRLCRNSSTLSLGSSRNSHWNFATFKMSIKKHAPITISKEFQKATQKNDMSLPHTFSIFFVTSVWKTPHLKMFPWFHPHVSPWHPRWFSWKRTATRRTPTCRASRLSTLAGSGRRLFRPSQSW